VFCLAVHFDQLSLKVERDLLENGLEPLEGVSVKDLSPIFCEEDQTTKHGLSTPNAMSERKNV
jgi:hypothetical protein